MDSGKDRSRRGEARGPVRGRVAALAATRGDHAVSAQRLAGHRQIATTQRYLGTSDAELKAFYKKHVG